MSSIMSSSAFLSASWFAARKFFCLLPHAANSFTLHRTKVILFLATSAAAFAEDEEENWGELGVRESFRCSSPSCPWLPWVGCCWGMTVSS
jgi:hypothetical protein